jgi:amino acid transporter/nucleotide-binding universal stress UspA family protein
MITISTNRPRNVDAPRAAAILYGDWGASKIYILGLAFAIGGYASFWLILPMCLLTALVGVNYMVICRHYPDGGGVYASVRHRSEILSIIGAFLLVADYLVTVAISGLSAFQYLGHYLGISHPEIWGAASILVIGGLNYFGPRHTGGLAMIIALPMLAVVILLCAFAVPHFAIAWHHIEPLQGGFMKNWMGFVGVVLALSGVEAVANATGVMKLNPDSTPDKPCVSKTSTPAVLWVMLEVCIGTAILGFAMYALNGLQIVPAPDGADVNAPGNPGVRDYMLAYMGEVFVGHAFGMVAAKIAAIVICFAVTLMLFSEANTAVVDLISIQFLMSRDGELPPAYQKLNKFGVPNIAILVATIIPAILVLVVKDMSGLADLYAIGVVGAIATNLGSSATDKHLNLKKWERWLMFFTFVVMLAIEISLFIDKPKARIFAVTVLAIGLILRGLASEHFAKKKKVETITPPLAPNVIVQVSEPQSAAAFREPLLCAVRGIGKTLDYAIEEAKDTGRPLYVLFVREQSVITSEDRQRHWQQDEDATKIFEYARSRASALPCYSVSDSAADTIVDVAATLGVSRLILGSPRRTALISLLRGDIIRSVSALLPDNVHLLVYA